MKLARATVGGRSVVGVVVDNDTVLVEIDLPGADPLLDWLRSGVPAPEPGRSSARHPLDSVELLTPLARPGKIIAIGLNYADHTAETKLDAPTEPLTFAKYPSSVIGSGQPIRVPAAVTTQVDWEAELAVVIGAPTGAPAGPGRAATTADIGAYTVANDVSARDLQFRDGQWTRAKSIDSFCPLGPWLVTPDELPDPHDRRIWTTVNGTTMQDATTGDMIFDIPALLTYLSATTTLEPGDVILTGTPPGVGGFRTPPVFLGDGDVVEVGVEGIGTLRNPVVHL